MNYFEKLIDYAAWFSAWLFCLAGFMLSYEVMARYFFLSPTIWAAELSQISLIYGTLLAMPWALKSRKPKEKETGKPDNNNININDNTIKIVILVITFWWLYIF